MPEEKGKEIIEPEIPETPDEYAVVNVTKLNAAIAAEADALRSKLGNNETLTYDLEREGFASIIADLPHPDVGFEATAWNKDGYPTAGTLYNITDIPAYFFSGEQFSYLQNITFVNCGGIIGEGAFSGCPLTSIDFGDSSFTSIGDLAFEGSDIRTVTIPASMASVSATAFNKSGVAEVYCCWIEGENPLVEANAPWGAVNATIHYNDPYYIVFRSIQPFTLSTNNNGKNWDGIIEYSTDRTMWIEWNGVSVINSSKNFGCELYLRGSNNTYITGGGSSLANTNARAFVLSGQSIACWGNIEGLLDYQTVRLGSHPTMANCCFASLFYNCSQLISSPELPAITLKHGCYYNMFSGCTSLTSPPSALPAPQAIDYCYSGMFSDCTSLEVSPTISATTVATGGCMNMFKGCTSLTTPPAIHILSFSPRTVTYSCAGMFHGCTSLARLPVLYPTALKANCYTNMFQNCSLIKLSPTQTGQYQYEYRIPKEGNGSVGENSLMYMFAGTGGTFTGTPTVNTTYYTTNPPVD